MYVYVLVGSLFRVDQEHPPSEWIFTIVHWLRFTMSF